MISNAAFATLAIRGSGLTYKQHASVRERRSATASAPFLGDMGNAVKPAQKIPTIAQKYVIVSERKRMLTSREPVVVRMLHMPEFANIATTGGFLLYGAAGTWALKTAAALRIASTASPQLIVRLLSPFLNLNSG